jgi:hypothetical protein
MSQIVERGKNRLLVTVVLLAIAVALVAFAVFLLMPGDVLSQVYDFFGGDLDKNCPWQSNPFLLYVCRVLAVFHAWVAALFVLIMLDPLKYRTIYWVNMLALLAMGAMVFGAGFSLGMPFVAVLIDGVLCLLAVVGLWAARPKVSV